MIKSLTLMKIIHIVGARPQFIKAAMVSKAWLDRGEQFILHTGQHYSDNMSQLFFTELQIPKPHANLGIGSGSHAQQTSGMLMGIDQYLEVNRPHWVVIYGDTNSTLAGALSAAKRHIPIAHVEAGLRSFNRTMPEEINRVVSDHLSDLLFCPTEQSVLNLKKEGITKGVHQVGDVMADVLFASLEIAQSKSSILKTLGLQSKSYALVTIHRSGNVDDKETLASILKGLADIQFNLVFPIHPRTKKMISHFGFQIPANLKVIEPVGYLDMLMLENNAECILTDSGGIQKEAYLLGVRCITLREETEWVETVTAGWNFLAGSNSIIISSSFTDFKPAGDRLPIYGEGNAAGKIAEIILNN